MSYGTLRDKVILKAAQLSISGATHSVNKNESRKKGNNQGSSRRSRGDWSELRADLGLTALDGRFPPHYSHLDASHTSRMGLSFAKIRTGARSTRSSSPTRTVASSLLSYESNDADPNGTLRSAG